MIDKEICTLHLGKNSLDNDYTIYKSGKIRHFFDQSSHKPNMEEWLKPSDIDDGLREKLLNKCPVNLKAQVEELLSS